ncbi:MAG: CoA-binding protein [Myxococcota bacterium]
MSEPPLPLLDDEAMVSILRSSRTIAVLGIRSRHHADRAAYWVPEYLAEVGYRIVPVPTHPLPAGVERILGERAWSRVLREANSHREEVDRHDASFAETSERNAPRAVPSRRSPCMRVQ